MDRVYDAALRGPVSAARDEAVHGIQEATDWALTITQRGSQVDVRAIVERAQSAARLYGRLRLQAAQDGADVDGVLRDAFATAGW
jgi:hypothetical protein